MCWGREIYSSIYGSYSLDEIGNAIDKLEKVLNHPIIMRTDLTKVIFELEQGKSYLSPFTSLSGSEKLRIELYKDKFVSLIKSATDLKNNLPQLMVITNQEKKLENSKEHKRLAQHTLGFNGCNERLVKQIAIYLMIHEMSNLTVVSKFMNQTLEELPLHYQSFAVLSSRHGFICNLSGIKPKPTFGTFNKSILREKLHDYVAVNNGRNLPKHLICYIQEEGATTHQKK